MPFSLAFLLPLLAYRFFLVVWWLADGAAAGGGLRELALQRALGATHGGRGGGVPAFRARSFRHSLGPALLPLHSPIVVAFFCVERHLDRPVRILGCLMAYFLNPAPEISSQHEDMHPPPLSFLCCLHNKRGKSRRGCCILHSFF